MNKAVNIPAWITESWLKTSDNYSFPAWFASIKQKQWNDFLKSGLPTPKDERWKYADLSFLAKNHFSAAKKRETASFLDGISQHRLQHDNSIMLVLVNGHFMPELSDMRKLPREIKVCSLREAVSLHASLMQSFYSLPSMDAKKDPFAALNTALCKEGVFIHLPDHYKLQMPIHLLSLVDNGECAIHPHHMIVLNPHSQLTLVEEYFSLSEQMYLANMMMTVHVAKQAQLTHYKIQNEGKNAIHLAHHFVQQMEESVTRFMNFAFGGLFARDNLAINLHEKGATCQANGFYHLSRMNQYVDHHVNMHHEALQSESEMLYKGILEHSSRAVFHGRVLVAKEAQKIKAYQANHHLLLSNQAEIYTRPELEIYADDIKCKHGATTGQVDQAALFYLCSRGIPKEEAVNILLQGFADEVIQRISHKAIKMRVQEMMVQ